MSVPSLPVLVVATLLLACRGHAEPPAAPAPVSAQATAPEPGTTPIEVQTSAGNRLPLRVELARTDEERTRGLMFRRSMAPDAGMFFFMPGDSDWSFWMKNTLIPLDLLFVDADGRVVGVVEDARPLDETSRRVGKPSRYVLEVNGGWCRRNGVGAGARVTIPGTR